jgi:nucleotide-binding universal stress UspA family protein
MKAFRKILYVSEPSVAQEKTLARAASLARTNQASLSVVDVLPAKLLKVEMPGAPDGEALRTLVLKNRRDAVERMLAPYKGGDAGDIEIDIHFGEKTFIDVIRKVAAEGFDLVIKPAENPDWLDRLFGSEDMHLIRKCPCPVWLMQAEESEDYKTVLAAIDFDPDGVDAAEADLNHEILSLAAAVALADFAALHVIHVWDAPQADFVGMWAEDSAKAEADVIESARRRHKAGLDAAMRQLRETLGAESYDYLAPRLHQSKGKAQRSIPQKAKEINADLVVMGTVARTGIPGFFIGNTAEAVLDQLQCALLALKPTGFVSPVLQK